MCVSIFYTFIFNTKIFDECSFSLSWEYQIHFFFHVLPSISPPEALPLSLCLHLNSALTSPPFGNFPQSKFKNGFFPLSLKVRLAMLSVSLLFLFYPIKWHINSWKKDMYTKGLSPLSAGCLLVSALTAILHVWFSLLLSQCASQAWSWENGLLTSCNLYLSYREARDFNFEWENMY